MTAMTGKERTNRDSYFGIGFLRHVTVSTHKSVRSQKYELTILPDMGVVHVTACSMSYRFATRGFPIWLAFALLGCTARGRQFDGANFEYSNRRDHQQGGTYQVAHESRSVMIGNNYFGAASGEYDGGNEWNCKSG